MYYFKRTYLSDHFALGSGVWATGETHATLHIAMFTERARGAQAMGGLMFLFISNKLSIFKTCRLTL